MRENMKILILGGTREARLLAEDPHVPQQARFIFSLAGVTQAPDLPHVQTRLGGFGGIEGLIAYLKRENIAAVIDATHPFAARISHHAAAACAATCRPILRLGRPAWRKQPGDHWVDVATLNDAIPALGMASCRVLLTTGRQHVAPFMAAPQHRYFLRSIEPVSQNLPAFFETIIARPPFTLEDELALFTLLKIDTLVTKNSGAPAIAAKLDAARQLGLRVVMINRPPLPPIEEVSTIEGALQWVARLASEDQGASSHASDTLRGV
ncbi:cobalt-precorrin-6A reductase [Candidatus Kirkpatrickella diaphorinae]|uniref:Cobalt-precorrin-6A reductase n=1 Tax=Candidatus Kirkpatrickella diaphorinae TaxID=2984322 RepID=A0ABY6GIT1_9PROT|nr:cobalt-precorrin-6A reductase [Candidatus Kirkpatrickella diaphorinae]UYH51222.1 cobalt-precorrin-6A reductase [Candidatus Kirkpatrickella diaphorinae]